MIDNMANENNLLHENVSALEKHYPQIYSALKVNIFSCSISFFGPDNKSLTITGNQKQITIHAHDREAGLSKIVNPGINEPIYLIIGLGVGDELHKLFDITRLPIPELPDYKLPIYVLEPEPLMLIAVMWMFDIRELLESNRVQWFIGEDPTTELAEYLKSHRQALCPTHFISHWCPEGNPAVQTSNQYINELTNQTNASIYLLKIKINNYYNKITPDEWRDIFTSKKRPLRIMGGTSRFTTFLQYCMRDLLSGFKELGHETLLYNEESNVSRITEHDILATIDEFQPDLIINIDHNRCEFPYLPINIPFMNWIQDLLPTIIHPERLTLNPYDFIFVFADRWVNHFKDNSFYKGHDIHFLPLGINKEIYHPLPHCEKLFDVLYVSHIIEPGYTLEPFYDTSQEIKLTNSEVSLLDTGVIDYEQLMQIYTLIHKLLEPLLIDELYTYSYDKNLTTRLFEDILNTANIEKAPLLLEHFNGPTRLTNEINFRVKTLPIKALKEAGLSIRVYGRNWEKIPVYSDISYGPIENGHPLNLLMNQARICLNNSPGTSFHMRALEILGSGSCMISRRIKQDICDITSVFPEYTDVVLFNNELDVVDLAKHYVKNKQERQHIANSGYEHAIEKFSYKNISKKILTTIRETI